MRIVAAVIVVAATSMAFAQEAKVETTTGDSNVIMGSRQYNKGSSLKYNFIAINDPASPVQLVAPTIRPLYGRDVFYFMPTGSMTATSAVSAVEVHFVLYDVFGRHQETLANDVVVDLAAGAKLEMSKTSRWGWRAVSTDEAARFLTAAMFVSRVRNADGTIWTYNEALVRAALAKATLPSGADVLKPAETADARD